MWERESEGRYILRERDGFVAVDTVNRRLMVTAQTGARLGLGTMTDDLAIILAAMEGAGLDALPGY